MIYIYSINIIVFIQKIINYTLKYLINLKFIYTLKKKLIFKNTNKNIILF